MQMTNISLLLVNLINFTSAKGHILEAERNNQVIKERVRAVFHHWTYKNMQKVMTQILVMDSAMKLFFFHQREGFQLIIVRDQ